MVASLAPYIILCPTYSLRTPNSTETLDTSRYNVGVLQDCSSETYKLLLLKSLLLLICVQYCYGNNDGIHIYIYLSVSDIPTHSHHIDVTSSIYIHGF